VKPDTKNWLGSADYDLESAHNRFSTRRFLYVVFLCHLTIEKLLKALINEKSNSPPARSHDLIFLLKEGGLTPQPERLEFIGKINNASIPTRYPADIQRALKDYNQTIAQTYLDATIEVAKWLKSDPRLKP
jgi:HEPN domain-containing protein